MSAGAVRRLADQPVGAEAGLMVGLDDPGLDGCACALEALAPHDSNVELARD